MAHKVSFTYNGSEQSWAVPSGVTGRIRVLAAGAAGGDATFDDSFGYNTGGKGYQAQIQPLANSSHTYHFLLGQRGEAGGRDHTGFNFPKAGGLPNGARGGQSDQYGFGGGGGGCTYVGRSDTPGGTKNVWWVLAGGGGAGGGTNNGAGGFGGSGGWDVGSTGGSNDASIVPPGTGASTPGNTPGQGGFYAGSPAASGKNGGNNMTETTWPTGYSSSFHFGGQVSPYGEGGLRQSPNFYAGGGGGAGGGWGQGGGGAGDVFSVGGAGGGGGSSKGISPEGINYFIGTAPISADGYCNFIYNYAPTQPGSLSAMPGNTETNNHNRANNLNFSWGASSDAGGESVRYDAELRRASDNALIKSATSLTGTSHSFVMSDVAQGNYYVQVRARDDHNNLEGFDPGNNFSSYRVGSTFFNAQISAVGQTRQAIHHVRGKAARTLQAIYHSRARVGQSRQVIYTLRAAIGKILTKQWHNAALIMDSFQAIYNLTVPVGGQARTLIWDGRHLVLSNSELKWDLRSVVTNAFTSDSHTRILVTDSYESVFHNRITVNDDFVATHHTRANVGDPYSVVFSGETHQTLVDNFQKTFTFQADAEGFTGAGGGTRNTLVGNPAAGMDVTVDPAGTGTSTARCTAGGTQTLASLFGIPTYANITSIRLISVDRRVTGATGVSNMALRVTLRSSDNTTQIHQFVNQTNQGVDLAHETINGNTYTPASSIPGSATTRIALEVAAGRTVALVPGSYTVNFDNVAFELDYYTQTAGKLFRAIFAGGGFVTADGVFIFNDMVAIGEPVEVRFSGNKAEGKSLVVDSNTKANVFSEEEVRFHAANPVGDSEELVFNTTEPVDNGFTAEFNNQFPVGDGQALIFGTSSNVGQSVEIPYNGRLLAGRDFESRYSVYENATSLETIVYSIVAHITQTFNVLFNNTIPVGDPYELRYNARELIAKGVELVHGIRSVVWDDFRFRFRSRSYKNWIEDAQESTIYTPDADEADAWVRVNDPAPQTFTPDPDESDSWVRVNNPNPGIFIPRETE